MNHVKTTACLMAGMLILAGTTGCNRSNVQPGSSQDYGRSYVREAPETTEEKKEEKTKTEQRETQAGPVEKEIKKTSSEEIKKHDGLTNKETTKKESTKEGSTQPGRT